MNNNCSCCSWLMGLFLVIIATAFFAGMSKNNKSCCNNNQLTYTVECIGAIPAADTVIGNAADAADVQDVLSHPENYSAEHIQYANDVMAAISMDTLPAENWKVDIVGFFN